MSIDRDVLCEFLRDSIPEEFLEDTVDFALESMREGDECLFEDEEAESDRYPRHLYDEEENE